MAKGIGAISTVITVPLTIGYLGDLRYGVWMTIASVVTLGSFLNLGVGLGLKNSIARACGTQDLSAARRAIAGAYGALGGLSAALGIGLASSAGSIPWADWINVPSGPLARETNAAVTVCLGCFLVSIPLELARSIQEGMQAGYRAAMWQVLATCLSLGGTCAAAALRAPLPWLVLAASGAPCIAHVANTVTLFRGRKDLRPTRADLSVHSVGDALKAGLMFLGLQVVAAIAFASDNIIITRGIGPEAVAGYSVAYRYYLMVSLAIGILIGPLWPAYGEARSRGDLDWIRGAIRRSVRLTCAIAIPAGVALAILGRDIVCVWAGKSLWIDSTTLLGLAVWIVVSNVGAALSTYLSAISVVGTQLFLSSTMAIVAIGLKLILVGECGTAGVVWGTVVAYCSCSLLPMLWLVPKHCAARLDLGGGGCGDTTGVTPAKQAGR